MSVLAIVLALMLEQVRPMVAPNALHRWGRLWGRWCLHSLDAGKPSHGWLVWVGAVVLPALVVWAVHAAVSMQNGWSSGLVTFFWHLLILWFTVGFRQFSHHVTAFRQAADEGDWTQAEKVLLAWQGVPLPTGMGPPSLLSKMMGHATVAAHRHVFGVIISYVVCAALGLGPSGAVLYCLAGLAPQWLREGSDPGCPHPSGSASQRCAQVAWDLVDAVPTRLTVIGFAVVGNFEEVIEVWRNPEQASDHTPQEALLVQAMRAALSLPGAPQPEHVASLVGLVWRSTVLWILLIALLSLAGLIG